MSYDDETRTYSTGPIGHPSAFTPNPAYPVNSARPAPRRGLTRFVPHAIAAVGLAAAALFFLLPLPTLDVLGTPVGFCGPGPTSDNALQVLIDPSVVSDQGKISGDDSIDGGSKLQAYCLGKAKDRGYYGALAGGGGLVAALGVAYAQMRRRDLTTTLHSR